MRRGRVAREARQAAAKERQAMRDSRTDEQQLHKLISEGHGHCKEAQRIAVGVHQRNLEWAVKDD